MPRYFFNLHDGDMSEDEDGTELPSLEAAKKEAVRYMGELLLDTVDRIWDGHDWRLEVSDGVSVLFTLSLSASITRLA